MVYKADYEYEGETYEIYYLAPSEWKNKTPGWHWLKRWLIRGMVQDDTIFIKDTASHDHKLIKHEIGHLLGYKHTWRFYLNNPSWAGRWFNKFYDNRE